MLLLVQLVVETLTWLDVKGVRSIPSDRVDVIHGVVEVAFLMQHPVVRHVFVLKFSLLAIWETVGQIIVIQWGTLRHLHKL